MAAIRQVLTADAHWPTFPPTWPDVRPRRVHWRKWRLRSQTARRRDVGNVAAAMRQVLADADVPRQPDAHTIGTAWERRLAAIRL